MTAMRKIQIELPEEVAEGIDRRVASGEYSDASAVIRQALDDRFQDDPVIEHWLRTEVVPTYDRWKREGSRGLTSKEVFGGLEARYLAQTGGE